MTKVIGESEYGFLDVNSMFKIKNLNFKAVFKNMFKLVREGREWQWSSPLAKFKAGVHNASY